MEWWNDTVVLSWLSIGLVVFGLLIGLYFESDRFASGVKKSTQHIRAFIGSNGPLVLLFAFLILAVILVLEKQFLWLLVSYSLLMTFMAYTNRFRNRSSSELVTCRLGDLSSEGCSRGLAYVPWTDGDCIKEIHNSEYIRRTDVANMQAYMYFAIDEEIASEFRNRDVYIVAEYLDSPGFGGFHIHYDSLDRTHPNPRFKSTDRVEMRGSGEWKVGAWKVSDGRFNKSQQENADFRFRCIHASSSERPSGESEFHDLHLRRVSVVAIN